MDRRTFLAWSGAAAVAVTACKVQAQNLDPVVRPEDFGAVGDGVSNDSDAFTAVSRRIAEAGGGTILLSPGKTYLVGRQQRGGARAWEGQPLLSFRNLSRPLVIDGQGARMIAAAGLRFGTFDRVSDEPVHRPLPNSRGEEVASPYEAMIDARNCLAPITIRNIELDGRLPLARLGGPYGDQGWQIPASGIFLRDNRSDEILENILSTRHGQDGVMIDASNGRSGRTHLTKVRCIENGRQGLSIIGGSGFDLVDCDFSRTGRGAISSAPAAGVDIEAESKPIRDLRFSRCTFSDNVGVGLLAEAGNVADASFDSCRFVGTTVWSCWPRKPGFVFRGSTFVGAMVNPYADAHDAAAATQFIDCLFTDDPAQAPGGRVYTADPTGSTIADLGQSENVLFRRCRFILVGKAVLPWTWAATYEDCVMRQASPKDSHSRGTYLGTNSIEAPAPDLYSSKILGTLTVNGKLIPRTG